MNGLIYSLEDDKDIAKIINKTLSKQGYEVVSIYDGRSFYEKLKERKPNMILLDMMLPDCDGIDILKDLRSDSRYDEVFILIISARRMLTDRVDGCDLGADDYIEKPFDILELMSRVNARFRRIKNNHILKYNDFEIDKEYHLAKYKGVYLDLTIKEFQILELLVKACGKVVTREEIYSYIWGELVELESRTIDMHVKAIRKKIGDDSIIETVYGLGYKVK